MRIALPHPHSSFFILHSNFFILLLLLLLLSCTKRDLPTTHHDDLSRPITLPREITRVVSLAPNLTEMVFAIGAGEKLVGTDDHSNFPEAAKKIAKVGGMQPNVEKIAALKPDVVIASTEGNHPNLAQALAAAKIPLYVVRTDRLEEIAPAMQRLGTLLDAPGANDAVGALHGGIEAQRRPRANAPR
ncbi:MAG TPA: helical backbone metal receptor, partial [Thermoanaerobaculia bacterium]|nr:helical backbone metal receptor [Thermoanaerobaculia bacterium]